MTREGCKSCGGGHLLDCCGEVGHRACVCHQPGQRAVVQRHPQLLRPRRRQLRNQLGDLKIAMCGPQASQGSVTNHTPVHVPCFALPLCYCYCMSSSQKPSSRKQSSLTRAFPSGASSDYAAQGLRQVETCLCMRHHRALQHTMIPYAHYPCALCKAAAGCVDGDSSGSFQSQVPCLRGKSGRQPRQNDVQNQGWLGCGF